MANEAMTKLVEYEVNGEPIKLNGNMVREYLVSENAPVSDQEIVMFLQLCKFQKLNPFLNEAYLVKYRSKQGPDKPAQIIVSKEAFMKRANSNPHFRGLKAGIMVANGDDIKLRDGAVKLPKEQLIGGWATVERDDREATHVEISLDEFGKGQSTWKSMPNNMIRKTAIVNALREAFPETLGDMYTEDDKNPHEAPVQVKQATEHQTVDDLLSKQPEPEPETNDEIIIDDDPLDEVGNSVDKEEGPNGNSAKNPENLFENIGDLIE